MSRADGLAVCDLKKRKVNLGVDSFEKQYGPGVQHYATKIEEMVEVKIASYHNRAQQATLHSSHNK